METYIKRSMPSAPADSRPAHGSSALRRSLRRLRLLAPLAVGALALLAALSGYARSANAIPWLDECNYLNEANWIAEHGGPLGFLSESLRGNYPFDSRTPGLPLLGSLATQRSLAGVRPFRALNAALAFAALLGLYYLLKQAAGWRVGLFAVAVLSASGVWFDTTAILGVEPFVYLPFAAAWLLLSGWWQPKGRWFWAGLAVGLAYFFKGTANVLYMALALAGMLEILQRLRAGSAAEVPGAWWRTRLSATGLFALGALLGAGPVWLNNLVRYGNPFFNKNARVLWMDAYDQRLADGGDFSFLGYLRTHSLRACIERLSAGLAVQWENLLNTLGSAALPWSLVASVLLVLAVYGICADRIRWRRNVSLALVVLFVLLFAWWSRFGNVERFTGTLGPLLALYAALGAHRLLRRVPKAKRMRLPTACAALLLFTLNAGWGMAQGIRGGDLPPPSQSLQPPESYANLHAWLLEHAVKRGELTLVPGYFRPKHDLFWLLPQPMALALVPPALDYNAFSTWCAVNRARWLVIETNSWRDREALLAPYARTTEQGGVIFTLPGWKLAGVDATHAQPAYLIYEREE